MSKGLDPDWGSGKVSEEVPDWDEIWSVWVKGFWRKGAISDRRNGKGMSSMAGGGTVCLERAPGVWVNPRWERHVGSVVAVWQACLLKCGVYDFSGMEEPTDQETITTEKIICYTHKSQEEGAHEGAPGSVRGLREWGRNVGKSLYCGFCGKEQARQGMQFRIGKFE